MKEESLPSISDLPTIEVRPVEHQCKRFEAAWNAWREGPRPSLEEHLAGFAGVAHDVLLARRS